MCIILLSRHPSVTTKVIAIILIIIVQKLSHAAYDLLSFLETFVRFAVDDKRVYDGSLLWYTHEHKKQPDHAVKVYLLDTGWYILVCDG